MDKLYPGLDYETAQHVDTLSRLMYELRENRKNLLAAVKVDSDSALFDGLRNGSIAEHPGYEHWLAHHILAETAETVRRQIEQVIASVQPAAQEPEALPVPIHLQLLEALHTRLPAALAAGPELHQDALLLKLRNGVTLTVRYATPHAFSLRWAWPAQPQAESQSPAGDTDDTGVTHSAGIDTAPCHAGHPHLHLDGQVRPAPLIRCDASPEENLFALIEALDRDPRLIQDE